VRPQRLLSIVDRRAHPQTTPASRSKIQSRIKATMMPMMT
jgi:hypothetical protein